MLANENEAQNTVLEAKLDSRLSGIKRIILVLSGKGGVGKSMLAANLAVALAENGLDAGLLDVDLHGPSIPGILGIRGQRLDQDDDYDIIPLTVGRNLKVVSIGLMLSKDTTPVAWRGPKKFKAIRQLLRDVVWGGLDVLVIDAPPGTGDEAIAVAKLAGDKVLSLIVTTSQRASMEDAARCVEFCKKSPMRIAGIVENFSGQVCPHCGALLDIFPSGGGERLAEKANVPFLGRIPVDPMAAESNEQEEPFILRHPHCPASRAVNEIMLKLTNEL